MRLLTRWTFLLAATVTGFAQTPWVDPSPHRQRLVQVGSDARLEVLDWRGSGQTLALLAQLGTNRPHLRRLGPDAGQRPYDRTNIAAEGAIARRIPQRGPTPADIASVEAGAASPEAFPGCQSAADPAVRQACKELHGWTLRQLEDSKKLVGTIRSRTQMAEITGADGFMFLSNPGDVMRVLEPFLAALAR